MQYDEVVATAFQPSPQGLEPTPTLHASPARRLRDALEPIAMHSVWSRGVNERLAGLGHNFRTGYVCSRAALMGAPDPGVVGATFAVFEPNMIGGIYEASRSICDRDTLLAARTESVDTSLGAVLSHVDPSAIATVTAALRKAVEDAPGVGRPLFSGLQNQPWPTSAVAQLWRACEQFREHRGDSHVAVCVAAGLDAVEMNVLTELWLGMPFGEYSASRGWDEVTLAAAAARLADYGWVADNTITAAGTAYRDDLEHRTDVLQQSIIDSLGAELDDIVVHLADWSQRCVEAKAFPPNAFKRAAG